MRDVRSSTRDPNAFSLTARMIPRNPSGNQPEKPSAPRTHRVPLGAASPVPGAVEKAAPISIANDTAKAAHGPRESLIIVLPDNHVVSTEILTQRVEGMQDREVDVIVVCAGQPSDLPTLQRMLRHAQVMLAPAGTSAEDLRVLALAQATGDIVTVIGGSAPVAGVLADRERLRS